MIVVSSFYTEYSFGTKNTLQAIVILFIYVKNSHIV